MPATPGSGCKVQARQRMAAGRFLGCWRILRTDRECLEKGKPAFIVFEADGMGEFLFGTVKGWMDCRYGQDGVSFTWQGFDEMEPASGAGTARLDEAGALTGEIQIHFGEESAF